MIIGAFLCMSVVQSDITAKQQPRKRSRAQIPHKSIYRKQADTPACCILHVIFTSPNIVHDLCMDPSSIIFIAQENRLSSDVPAHTATTLTMPSFIENDDPPSSAMRGRVDHQQASSEMEDATVHNSGARRILASRPSRQNEMARQGNISAPTTDTDDQAHSTIDVHVSTTREKEGSTFYLLLNDVDDDVTDHFQRDSEATMADSLPKRFCRRRRKQRRYPKECHIVLVARDLLAQINDIDE